jgi:uncharacterized membrane protein
MSLQTLAATKSSSRLDSVDLLRGLVMVLMALDHTRDFFHTGAFQGIDPLDLTKTTGPLYFTRWITHFCAPVFLFLAGTGAFLSTTRGKSKRDLSWFLFTRGLWLVLLELTWIRWAGWAFAINLNEHWGIVIWAIGWSMVALAALVHLPTWAITTFGIAMITTHNASDGLKPETLGSLGWLWRILHAGGQFQITSDVRFGAGYPLIPWIGVMAAGYGFGPILLREPAARQRWLFRVGLNMTVVFFLLRFSNLYGDAKLWSSQSTGFLTLLSMLDCTKYPPSLCYLLMTLGPAAMLLALLDRIAVGGVRLSPGAASPATSSTHDASDTAASSSVSAPGDGRTPRTTPAVRSESRLAILLRPILVFGRVPLFYYLIHLPLIHALAVAVNILRCGHANWLHGSTPAKPPPDAGFDLWVVYVAWIIGVFMLYPACQWFAGLKRRRREAWLSYL